MNDVGATIVSVLVVLGVILVSMVLHELAHGVTAYLLGDNTAKEDGRLTLNPLKHIDPIMSVALPLVLLFTGGPVFGGAKPVPVDSRNLKFGPWGMAIVAIMGPLTNFVIAFVMFLIGHFTGLLYDPGIWGMIFMNFVMINLGFGIFNLLPIPPLDGSRVIYAIAPDPVRDFMGKFENFGLIVVLILVVAVPGLISTIMGGAMNGILTAFYWIVGVHVG